MTMAESPARWVLADGWAHLLASERPGGVLVARCGHSLSRGVLQHHRLPSRELCVTCVSAYLLPEPVFSRTSIGRRLSAPGLAPGDRSDPAFSETPADRRLSPAPTASGSWWSAGSRPIERSSPMTAEKSHRFALTGSDPEGRNRTIIL